MTCLTPRLDQEDLDFSQRSTNEEEKGADFMHKKENRPKRAFTGTGGSQTSGGHEVAITLNWSPEEEGYNLPPTFTYMPNPVISSIMPTITVIRYTKINVATIYISIL